MIRIFYILTLSFTGLLISAQKIQTALALGSISSLNLSASTSPLTLALPASDNVLTISVALCNNPQPIPNFSVTNDSNEASRLSFQEGIGSWRGHARVGSKLVVSLGDGASNNAPQTWSFEVGVTDRTSLHRNLSQLPLLGDTTATQALIFSPPFSQPNHIPPSYPNYTLPTDNSSVPDPPSLSVQPNASLILAPTSQLEQHLDTHLSLSSCAIQAAARNIGGAWIGNNGTGGVNGSTSLVLRDREGWRSQWVIEGLKANTNYTAIVVQDGGVVSDPIYAFTKSSSFACPLVHSLPYCPLTSYAVALPPPPNGTTYTSSNIPTNASNTLITSITNFTMALLTFPCGLEAYSPLQSCENCQDAYRSWICAVFFPRCGEIPAPLSSSLAAQPTSTHSSNTGLPVPALLPHPPAPARNTMIPDISSTTPYNELLPCIETCQLVDRACPPVMSWSCPEVDINANWSYGIGFIDGQEGDKGRGNPGVAQDRWGVAWCNG